MLLRPLPHNVPPQRRERTHTTAHSKQSQPTERNGTTTAATKATNNATTNQPTNQPNHRRKQTKQGRVGVGVVVVDRLWVVVGVVVVVVVRWIRCGHSAPAIQPPHHHCYALCCTGVRPSLHARTPSWFLCPSGPNIVFNIVFINIILCDLKLKYILLLWLLCCSQ